MGNTLHGDKPKAEEVEERTVPEGDLLGNFVRRTDDDFRGVKDSSLIGEDIGDDEEEEEAR